MRLGEVQKLPIIKTEDFGVYLGSDEEKVLLPKKQVPPDAKPGDILQVFLYKDSEDRPIATTKEPALTLGGLAVLEVVEVNQMGAFLDWGLEKDLLLPYRQQTGEVKQGDRCLVSLYVDKSERLCATQKVYDYLRKDSPYQKDDIVSGRVYDKSETYGVYVAVDDRYSARIPSKDVFEDYPVNTQIHARVAAVKEDGKLELSAKNKIPQQMDADIRQIKNTMQRYGGELPFTDKADPERIKKELGMSKAAFKRAIGRMLKQGEIEITKDTIRLQRKD